MVVPGMAEAPKKPRGLWSYSWTQTVARVKWEAGDRAELLEEG